MSRRNLMIVGVFTILVLGVIFFLSEKAKQSNGVNKKDVNQTINVSDSDQKEISTISNWKKYHNEKYDYVVQYPADWTLKDNDKQRILLNGNANEESLKKIESGAMYGEGYMEDITISYYESISQEPENLGNLLDAKTLDALVESNPLISKIEKIKFAGQEAWLVRRGGFGAYVSVLVEHEGHLYEILFGNRAEKDELTPTDLQILDSFVFLK